MAGGGGFLPSVLDYLLLGEQEGVCGEESSRPEDSGEGDTPPPLQPAQGLTKGCWFWKPDPVSQTGATASESEPRDDEK